MVKNAAGNLYIGLGVPVRFRNQNARDFPAMNLHGGGSAIIVSCICSRSCHAALHNAVLNGNGAAAGVNIYAVTG